MDPIKFGSEKNSLSRENFPVLCRRASQAGLLLLLPLAIAPASFSFKNLILSAMAPELTWPNPLCKQTSFLKGIFLLRAFPRVLMDWLAGFLSLERTTKSSFFPRWYVGPSCDPLPSPSALICSAYPSSGFFLVSLSSKIFHKVP